MQKDHEWDMQFERFELPLRKKYPYNFHQHPTYFVEFPKLHLYRHLEDMLTRQIYLNSIKKSRDIRSSNMVWEKFPFWNWIGIWFVIKDQLSMFCKTTEINTSYIRTM